MAEGGGIFRNEGHFHFPHHRHQEGHVDPPAYPGSTQVSGEIVKFFCEARPDYNLAVRHHEVVLVPGDDSDPNQTWIKDESWSTKVKDSAGFPAFALINVGTGRALRHAEGLESPVLLEEYEPNVLNEVILWTAGADVSDGYRAIRPVSNIHLNLDADHGSEKYGGVKDGNKVILFKWKNESNQRWKWERVETRRDHHSRPREDEYENRQDHHSRPQERYDHHARPEERYDHHSLPQERYDHHSRPQERYDHHSYPQERYDHHHSRPQERYDHHYSH